MKSRESLIRVKRFQVDDKRRQVAQVEMMIAEFMRMIGDLDDQIVSEQNRVGIHDITHFAYPTFARAASSSPRRCPTPTGTSTSGTWSSTSRRMSSSGSKSSVATR